MNRKTRFEELAICGTAPAFASPLHVGRPNLPDRERLLARIGEVLDRDWLSNNGPCVQEFERRLAKLLGVEHCIAMCNATIGLEIAARALDFRGEVIVPSMTFIATPHALQWQQITPIFCDIDPDTHNLDPQCIEELITPRTTGVIGVHLWGRACDVAAITEIARRRRLRLLFDAAHAVACTYRGRPIGGEGDASVFSFHATKFFNTFEGGAVATNDAVLARKIRLMKNFGFAGYDNVVHLGINGKMTEPAAAMGLASLESIEDFRAINQRNYGTYAARLGAAAGLRLLAYDERERNNYQYIVVEVERAPHRPDTRRAPAGPARGKRAGPPLLLPRLSSHGALPHALPSGTLALAGHRGRRGPRPRAADRHLDRRSGDSHDLRHSYAGAGQSRVDEKPPAIKRRGKEYGGKENEEEDGGKINGSKALRPAIHPPRSRLRTGGRRRARMPILRPPCASCGRRAHPTAAVRILRPL